MLLIAAKILVAMRDEIKGRITFLFQPNEEVAGAEIMVEAGALENPRVDAAMGIHIWTPLPSGTIAATAGGVMATMDVFSIMIHGKGGHTGYPEDAIDPIIAAADLITTAQRIQTRDTSPLNPVALVFSKISAGTKNNIIPDEVHIEGSLRYLFEPTEKENPAKRLAEIVERVCSTHRCSYEFDINTENSVVINSPAMVQLARETALEILPSEADLLDHRSMAGEDFAAYAQRVPAAFVFLGTGNAEKKTDFPHHSPYFNVDEDTMPTGVELFVRTALRFFDRSWNFDVGRR
jgi:amidohydrolase